MRLYVVYRGEEILYATHDEWQARSCVSDNLDVYEPVEKSSLRIVIYEELYGLDLNF